MIYAIFFKLEVEEEEETDERIHSQYIEYIPRIGEGVEVLEENHIVKDIHYHIDETETYVQILLEKIKEQC